MDLELDGNAALVAASSSGLGNGVGTALAREGANVVVNGRNEAKLDAAVAEIREAATGDVVGQPADLMDPDDVETLVERTVDEFGDLDHLVTNAGGPPGKPFLDTTDREWYETYDLLVMSVVRLVRESTDHLRAGDGGSVVTVASRSVKEAIDDLVLSNSVRASVVGLEKTLSRELAPDVRANAVLPGTHATDRMDELVRAAVDRGDYESYEAGYEDWTEGIPVGHLGDPGEFGNLVAFLLSDRASFINGEAVTIDGGSGRSTL